MKNGVNDFCETSDGDIWIATAGGATRFDGSRFIDATDERHVLLKNKTFYVVRADSKNNLWFGTLEDGVISFGPTIRSPQSPDEKVNIESVGKFYRWLLEALKNVPKK